MTSRRSRLPLALLVASGLLLGRPGLARADGPDPWWGRDKALHFGFSAAIAGGGYAASTPFVSSYAGRAAFGGGLAVTAGVSKEVLDLAGLGDPSWRDLTWDVIGAAVGVGLSLGIDWAVRGH
jgi:putative lipoprotein